jgi:hypothetical protein
MCSDVSHMVSFPFSMSDAECGAQVLCWWLVALALQLYMFVTRIMAMGRCHE